MGGGGGDSKRKRTRGSKMSIWSMRLMSVNDIVPFISSSLSPQVFHGNRKPDFRPDMTDKSLNDTQTHRDTHTDI